MIVYQRKSYKEPPNEKAVALVATAFLAAG
jgi:hypothetical protein